MPSDLFLVLLGGLLVVAFLAEEAFVRLRVPPVLVLIGCGLLLGPVAGLLPADRFIQVAPHFGAFAFLLILFEGGLELNLKLVLQRVRAGGFLALMTFAFAFLSATAVGTAGGLSLETAIVLGVVLAPLSGAIVLPLAGRMGLGEDLRAVVVIEAALADVLGVLALQLVLKVSTAGGVVGLLALGSLLAAGFSIVLAILVGLLWPRVLRRLGRRRHVDVLTFGVAMALWGMVELPGASGALAVLVFGLTLANEQELLETVRLPSQPLARVAREAVDRLHVFIGELTFLVRAFFFVFLGVVVQFAHLSWVVYVQAVALVGLFLLSRGVVLDYSESRGAFQLDHVEKRRLLLLQPRGLVNAVLAIEAAHAGFDDDGRILGLASLVILLTNVLLIGASRLTSPSAPAVLQPDPSAPRPDQP